MLEPLPRILTYVFLVSTMLSIGLAVTGPEILGTMRDRRLMARLLLANFCLVPLLGYLLILTFPLSSGTKLALAMLALAPGGLRAIQFTDKVKGNLVFAAAAFFVLSLLSIVFTPLLVKVLLPAEIGVDLPVQKIVLFVLLYLLIPLAGGFIIHARSARGATALGRLTLVVSNTSFVATVLVTGAMNQEAIRSLGGHAILALLLLVLGSMVIGWWLGGPERRNRRVMAIATSMRNAGLCLLITLRAFPGSGADVAVIAFMGLMVTPNMLFTVYHFIRERRKRKKISPERDG
jgi:predicted Na+-dependent transporter